MTERLNAVLRFAGIKVWHFPRIRRVHHGRWEQVFLIGLTRRYTPCVSIPPYTLWKIKLGLWEVSWVTEKLPEA